MAHVGPRSLGWAPVQLLSGGCCILPKDSSADGLCSWPKHLSPENKAQIMSFQLASCFTRSCSAPEGVGLCTHGPKVPPCSTWPGFPKVPNTPSRAPAGTKAAGQAGQALTALSLARM